MLSLGQSEGGVKAALGAVNGILQSGRTPIPLVKKVASCSCSISTYRISAQLRSQRLMAPFRSDSFGVLGCSSALKGNRPWVYRRSMRGYVSFIQATVRCLAFWSRLNPPSTWRVTLDRRPQFIAERPDCQNYRDRPVGLDRRSITITDGIFGSNTMCGDLRIG
jgi:hypothetical protein